MENGNTKVCAALAWDWKEQPDITEIANAVNACIDNGGRPYFYMLDRECGTYVLLITEIPKLNDATAYQIWKAVREGGYEV